MWPSPPCAKASAAQHVSSSGEQSGRQQQVDGEDGEERHALGGPTGVAERATRMVHEWAAIAEHESNNNETGSTGLGAAPVTVTRGAWERRAASWVRDGHSRAEGMETGCGNGMGEDWSGGQAAWQQRGSAGLRMGHGARATPARSLPRSVY